MSVCCECCVLSGRDVCDEVVTRSEESYRLWCVFVSDLENLVNKEALAYWELSRKKKTSSPGISSLLFRAQHVQVL
jgi:hypothetical protein